MKRMLGVLLLQRRPRPDPEIAPDPGMAQHGHGTAQQSKRDPGDPVPCEGRNYGLFEGGNYGLFSMKVLMFEFGNGKYRVMRVGCSPCSFIHYFSWCFTCKYAFLALVVAKVLPKKSCGWLFFETKSKIWADWAVKSHQFMRFLYLVKTGLSIR